MRAYRSNAPLKTALDYAGGLKSIAEWCFKCNQDRDLFIYGLSEEIAAKIDAITFDIDPREHSFRQKRMEKFFLSDYFYLYLNNFFDQHMQEYRLHLGDWEFQDIEPLPWPRADAIALLLTS
jgi:hypothetical protein